MATRAIAYMKSNVPMKGQPKEHEHEHDQSINPSPQDIKATVQLVKEFQAGQVSGLAREKTELCYLVTCIPGR